MSEVIIPKAISGPKTAAAATVQRIQLITKEGLDWKVLLMSVSVLIAGVMASLLVKQWNYAAVGRNVTNDVVRFLEFHGSTKKKGVIQGGMLNSPMTVSAATTQIVARVLSVMNRIVEEEENKERATRAEEEAARVEAEKNKTKPKLCYDPPKVPAGKPAGTATTGVKHDRVKGGSNKKKPKPSSLMHPVAGSGGQPPGSTSGAESAESGAESDKDKKVVNGRPKQPQLFDPVDTRLLTRGQPEPDIEPYTPPMPVMPPGIADGRS